LFVDNYQYTGQLLRNIQFLTGRSLINFIGDHHSETEALFCRL